MNSIEWGELIAKKQTFLLDCMGMSREQMIMAGSIVTHGIKNYFRFARPKEYLPLSLYIDEAHLFVNPSLFDILKEGRRYKLSCCMATQDFAVIDEKMARVMCNAGTLISYRVGHREAQTLANEMGKVKDDLIEKVWKGEKLTEKVTVFNTKDILQNLEKYHVAYMTPKEKGIAKASRPPFFIPREPPEKVEPQRKSIKPSWFPLESYQKQPESQ
jgi:hypothetical protein